jgi:hypothetical protein
MDVLEEQEEDGIICIQEALVSSFVPIVLVIRFFCDICVAIISQRFPADAIAENRPYSILRANVVREKAKRQEIVDASAAQRRYNAVLPQMRPVA